MEHFIQEKKKTDGLMARTHVAIKLQNSMLEKEKNRKQGKSKITKARFTTSDVPAGGIDYPLYIRLFTKSPPAPSSSL